MSELYSSNLSTIEERWPEISKVIDGQDISMLDAQLVESKCQTISVNGIQLSSRYDALEEAFFYRGLTEGDVYYLFGCALGDIPKLLAHDKDAKEIHLFILSPDVFKLVLHFTEQPWLKDERFQLHLPPEKTALLDPYFAHSGAIILPSEKELCKRHNPSLYYRMENHLFSYHMNEGLLNEEQQAFDKQRLQENLSAIRKHQPVDRLVDRHKSRHSSIIVVGAGPSLEEVLPQIKRACANKRRPFVIAVSMAGKLLEKEGIVPDLLVHVDRGQGMEKLGKHLPDFIPYTLAKKGTALVYTTLVQKEIIENWAGTAYYANLNTADYDQSVKLLPTDRLYIYGSVIAPAVHMAMSFAKHKVYFAGMDFGFPDKKYHAGMSNDSHANAILMNETVLNGFDEEIETSRSYRTFLTGVETLVMSAPSLTFINCSRSGAKIAGTQYLDKQEIS